MAKSAKEQIQSPYRSRFTLTFAIEIVGLDVWHDCEEGWLDLGPPVNAMKIQYNLYPGQTYDIDVLIWPHTAKIGGIIQCKLSGFALSPTKGACTWHGTQKSKKIFCGFNYCWVRTWQFLERRWLAFSIRHALAVRVKDLQNHTATVNMNVGLGTVSAIAKNDKSTEVFVPKLEFPQRRYFAPVVEPESSLSLGQYLIKIIWESVIVYIPKTMFDDLFDTPEVVKDVRHQDAVIYQVQEKIINTPRIIEPIPNIPDVSEGKSPKGKIDPKLKKVEKDVIKYEIKLSGDTIIAGTGRLTPFEISGSIPPDRGETIVLLSTYNLPAEDDFPVIFFNIGKLVDIPVEKLMKLKISHIYTKWVIGEEEHSSALQEIKESTTAIDFNDHHAVLLEYEMVDHIKASFLDDYYKIELRGIRTPITKEEPLFFGYKKGDYNFETVTSVNMVNYDAEDIVIAIIKIDGRLLTKTSNGYLSGEYPLYPYQPPLPSLQREGVCTNDINGIWEVMKTEFVFPASIILEAQMTLDVSIGFVGCLPQKIMEDFGRFFCIIMDTVAVMSLMQCIIETNDLYHKQKRKNELMTGFCVDLGDCVFLYVEGPRYGGILKVWELAGTFHPTIRPVYSTSDKYNGRLYPELLLAPRAFNVLKMYAPISMILALPSAYTRPTLPLPTRSALLKLGRLITQTLNGVPSRDMMPTAVEFKSFKLELCVAPRPPQFSYVPTLDKKNVESEIIIPSQSRINWDSKPPKKSA